MPLLSPLSPLYTPTQSLDAKYTFSFEGAEPSSVVVSGNEPHAILYQGCTGLAPFRENMKNAKGNPVYSSAMHPQTNLATASLTMLYTDTKTDEGYLSDEIEQAELTINLPEKPGRIYSVQNLFDASTYNQVGVASNRAVRNGTFLDALRNRVEVFEEISSEFSLSRANCAWNLERLNETISGQNFTETFHHSEQTLMDYLSSAVSINNIVERASELDAEYIYGFVLDLYTQRMLCSNCNASLIGLKNSHEQGFIADLNEAFNAEGIESREEGCGTMLDVRVSATSPCHHGTLDSLRLPNDSGVEHVFDADDVSDVLQALNSSLGTAALSRQNNYDFSSYNGAFFASRDFARENLEKHLAAMETEDGLCI